jgi:hypothetical protein
MSCTVRADGSSTKISSSSSSLLPVHVMYVKVLSDVCVSAYVYV